MSKPWILLEEQKPKDDCDIRLVDGSIICNTLPQYDGDFYWRCRGQGEIFISEEAVIAWRYRT